MKRNSFGMWSLFFGFIYLFVLFLLVGNLDMNNGDLVSRNTSSISAKVVNVI